MTSNNLHAERAKSLAASRKLVLHRKTFLQNVIDALRSKSEFEKGKMAFELQITMMLMRALATYGKSNRS
eukprot:CAMPEP_0169061692 /NCGR_PEP_ID=MMETSP1015-20121227/264_1 /TAXON_ID=342587 /ORGANISM="Karlodinium micrum, Strain CCMP2283" /LENGTH=69 /DNA_ID=CAMNT_0009119733 /DNA_START=53 /DNA_END=262 /DNA_ORIENTATION=-